jgi:hypothetical protein
MYFCIGTVMYFNSIGFNTTDWRHSVDGTKVIVHDKFIKVLIPNYVTDTSISVFACPSEELDSILNSEEWKIK